MLRIALASVFLWTAVFAVPAAPLLTVPKVTQAPRIDGVPDEPVWQTAAVGAGFTRLGESAVPREPTRFRVLWDGRVLYLAVECAESALVPAEQRAEQVKRAARGRDGNVFADDVVEFFLDPRTDAGYVHLAVGAGGGRYDARGTNRSWDLKWTATARLANGRWTVEAAVPLEPILGQLPRPGLRLGFNVAREEKPVPELSAWAPVSSGFHEPDRFGTLVLADGLVPAISAETPTRSAADKCSFPVTVRGVARDPLRVEAVAGGQTLGTLTVPAGGPEKRTVALAVRPGANSAVTVVVSSGGRALFRSPPFPLAGLGIAVYRAKFAGTAGTLKLAVDGRTVGRAEAGQGLKCEFRLERGLHLVTISGDSPGKIAGGIETAGGFALRLDEAWRRFDGVPETGNDIAVDQAAAWPRAVSRTLGPGGGVFARAILVGGPARTPLTPNCRVAAFPKGTPEMVYPTLNPPPVMLPGPYTAMIELPAGFTFLAADGRAGQAFDRSRADKGEGGTLRIRLETAFLGRPGMEISSRFSDAANTTTGYIPTVRLGGTHDWRVCTARVRVPDNSVGLRPLFIKWQNRGVTGTCWIDDVEVREVDSGRLLFRRTFEEAGWQRKTYVVALNETSGGHAARIVALEKGQKRQQALWLVDEPIPVRPGALLEISCRAKCGNVRSRDTTAKAALVVRSEAAPGSTGTGRVWFTCGRGFLVEHPRQFEVRTLPPLVGRRPKRIRIVPCYYSDRFEETASRAMAENIDKAGITGIYGGRSTLVGRYVRSRLHYILSLPWHNGAAKMLGFAPGELPEDCRQLNYDGKRAKDKACPTWMLSDGRARFNVMGDWIAARLKADGGYDEVDWDYETPVVDPPTFCFCPRCLKAFAPSVHADPADLTAEKVVEEYRDPWVAFRCRQNAEIAGLVAEQVHRVAPGTLFSVYSGHQNRRTREHYGVDWELMAKSVDLGIAGYNASPEQARKTAAALAAQGKPFMGGEMYFLSLDGPVKGAWRPEGWKVRLVRQTVESGGLGCLIWWLPVMDGAGFYETSRAAGLMAAVEDFVTGNDRADATVRVRRGPARDVVVLRHGGRRCLLLFNGGAKARTFELDPGGGGPFLEALETGRTGERLGQTVTVSAHDVRAFVEQEDR
ncbi:MAG: hypothetical protein GXP31_11500 [Kiritimatiellaeota bacterium]|nr:hypothetical protein [Kiritimatiellota bacterium]